MDIEFLDLIQTSNSETHLELRTPKILRASCENNNFVQYLMSLKATNKQGNLTIKFTNSFAT